MPYANKKTRLEHQRNRRNRLRKQGVCTRCAGPRDDAYMDCSVCRKKSNKFVIAIIRKNIKNGNCACGKQRIKKKRICKRCSDVSRIKHRNFKKQVIAGYGGKCACCGEKQWEFLSVDHVNNDGAELRRKRGKPETSATLYRRLILENFPPEYQILCYNCNMAFGFFGYCPHNPKIRRTVKRT